MIGQESANKRFKSRVAFQMLQQLFLVEERARLWGMINFNNAPSPL